MPGGCAEDPHLENFGGAWHLFAGPFAGQHLSAGGGHKQGGPDILQLQPIVPGEVCQGAASSQPHNFKRMGFQNEV